MLLIPFVIGFASSQVAGVWMLVEPLTAAFADGCPSDQAQILGALTSLAQSCTVQTALALLVLPWVVSYIFWNFWYHGGADDFGVDTEKYIEFHNEDLRKQYANCRIPMCELCEFYADGDLSFRTDCEGGDVLAVLSKHRDEFVNYKTTARQLSWMLQQFLPVWGGHGHGNSSLKDEASTAKEIKEHYNRGNAFFRAFLGNAMVYTSGVFKSIPEFGSAVAKGLTSKAVTYEASASDGALEQAQFNKMQLVCEKLQLKEGERFLDIGCGWGTLIRHAVREYGAKATGVTLSEQGKRYCDETAAREKTPTETLCMDYRRIPRDRKFDKIASIEMAEHIGITNFVDPYLSTVRHLLQDDKGAFLMQVSGLRQGANWQDVAWGLFMSRYIFPGADASTPLHWYVKQLELAGFEVHSVETVGRHYAHTLHKWYDNWMSHKEAILSGELDAERESLRGQRLFRMWEFFLAYSVIASGQGSATCYQILAHPNTYEYPRDIWCDAEHVSYGSKTGSFDYAKGAPRRPESSPLPCGSIDASSDADADSDSADEGSSAPNGRSSSTARRRSRGPKA